MRTLRSFGTKDLLLQLKKLQKDVSKGTWKQWRQKKTHKVSNLYKLSVSIDESDKSDSSQQDDALDELQQRIKMLEYDLAAEVEKHKNTKGRIMFLKIFDLVIFLLI